MSPTSSTDAAERFDRLRAQYPDLGMAVYAYDPRGVVTLEIHTPEADTAPYTFTGATLAEVLARAFPEEIVEAAPPTESIFD
mgnify:CR=1 FL=1